MKDEVSRTWTVPDWDGKTEVSVIIPFCNEGSNVVFTAQAINEELHGFCKYEIILIDNQSDWYIDCNVKNERMTLMEGKERPYPMRSRAFFQRPPESDNAGSLIGTHFFRKGIMKYIQHDEKQGHWNAKNAGIEVSRGKYLFFLDAHCIMNRDGLRHMVEFLRNPPEKNIGGIHAYINYILDSRSLEYRVQRDKFFGYQFCTHQVDDYHVNEKGVEIDVDDTVRLVSRAAANPPGKKKDGTRMTWEETYGNNPIVKPFILPDNMGIKVDPSWPERKTCWPRKPYKVCVMSTCAMMCPRSVIQDLGGWHPEFGIYCGGEGYMNFKQSTCGYHHWIHPKSICWHWADKRGYQYWHVDYVRNEFIAAFVNGGETALQFCVEQRMKKGNRNVIAELADDVREKCKEEHEFIKSRQVETLEQYFNRWEAKPGIWR